MWFRKKKMVDIRELQKKGIIRIPKNKNVVLTNKEGFVDLRESNLNKTKSDNLFRPSKDYEDKIFSTEIDRYNKKEIDEKIFELDNKIYKLEQRVELLERKEGVNLPNNPDTSVLKW